MKAMFFGGDRYGARQALRILIEKNIEVVGCVLEEKTPNRLSELCNRNGIPCFNNSQLYESLEKGSLPTFDIGISYLYHRLLKEPIIEFANGNIINFHPAPIEIHRGVAACCYCLLHGYKEWAVTAHYVSAGIDEGDIIMQRKFDISGLRTAVEVEAYVQKQSIELFDEVITLFNLRTKIPRKKQSLESGFYLSRKELEEQKIVKMTDMPQDIDRKIMALWLPPYHGACIEINGTKYTLVNEELLKEIAELYQMVKGEEY